MTTTSPSRSAVSFKTIYDGFGDRAVMALGVTQTIGYGTLYYAYGVLAPAMAKDFDVGLDWLFGAFTVGLLVSGVAAPLIGRRLDQYGARSVMTVGSFAAAAALVFCAVSPNIWVFGLGVLFMELAACMVLYDAAFAGLTQIFRHDARRRITAITLIAGFASTLFWPLTQWMLMVVGWRWTYIIFAALHLFVVAALHWTTLKRALPLSKEPPTTVANVNEPAIHLGSARQRAFILYAFAICVSGLLFASFPIHMLRIIESEGFTAESAALVAMVMGPVQVLARIVEIMGGHRFDALMTGRVAMVTLVASVAVLLMTNGSLWGVVIFAAFYGVSQGLITIARGTVPLQLFGIHGYGALVGRVTGLRLLVNGAAPFAFAVSATHVGMHMTLVIAVSVGLVALLAFWALRKPN